MALRRSLVLGAMVGVLAAAPAGAQTVCNVIETLSPFGMIANKIFRTKLAAPFYGGACRLGFKYRSSICANKMKLVGVSIYGSGSSDSYLVSPRTEGAAIAFHHPARQYPCYPSSVDYVVTGGGKVIIKGDEEPDYIDIDTTGTHPLVSSCAGAILDMADLSQAIAAMPADKTLDPIKVRRGEVGELDATGGGIIRIPSISLAGGRGGVMYGYNYQCLYTYGFYDAGELEIIADPDDEVILDVGALKLGNCASVSLHGDKFLINVAGRGRKVAIGVDVTGDGYPINVLAPERTVKIEGERHGELGTYLGNVWANKVIARGYTYQETPTDCE